MPYGTFKFSYKCCAQRSRSALSLQQQQSGNRRKNDCNHFAPDEGQPVGSAQKQEEQSNQW